jgi:ATP-dependent Clp protease ATP-binding subunit ClpC
MAAKDGGPDPDTNSALRTAIQNAKAQNMPKDNIEKYGARPLARAIQKYVEDPLAEQIINSEIEEGDAIAIDLDKNKEEILVNVKKAEKVEKKKEE